MARHSHTRSLALRKRSAMSSAVSSVVSSAVPSRAPSPGPPVKPFRFFDLPSELRLRVYEMLLFMREPLDLDPSNPRSLYPRLALFLACRRMHDEACRVFYSQPVYIFPKNPRFFHAKKPLLARLPPHYRRMTTVLDWRVGPGWSAPPRCQNTGPALGLVDCTSVRTLRIFVEIDPSNDYFNGHRGENATKETYSRFCVNILRGILEQVPSVQMVEIDAYPSVKRDSPLVMALRRVIGEGQARLVWGPLREWEDADKPGLLGLETAMAGLGISDHSSRFVEVQA